MKITWMATIGAGRRNGTSARLTGYSKLPIRLGKGGAYFTLTRLRYSFSFLLLPPWAAWGDRNFPKNLSAFMVGIDAPVESNSRSPNFFVRRCAMHIYMYILVSSLLRGRWGLVESPPRTHHEYLLSSLPSPSPKSACLQWNLPMKNVRGKFRGILIN